MSNVNRLAAMAAFAVVGLLAAGPDSFAQSGVPNPYRPVKGIADGGGPFVPGGEWASSPAGPPASMYVDIDGESIWAVIRCDETSPVPVASGGRFGIDCLGPDNRIKNIDTIFKFDPKGKIAKSFGRGMFIWPHGLLVDREGNVWVTDAARQQAVDMGAKARVGAGPQVVQFSPDRNLLMT